MAPAVNMEQRSRFADMSAEQAVAAWRRRVAIINTIGIVLTLMAFSGYVLNPNPPNHLLAVLFVAYLCIFTTQWVFKTRNTNDLMKIASHDCDPAKLIKVIDYLMPAMSNKGAYLSFAAVYAACSTLMGYDDVAMEWVDQIESENPRDAAVRLSLVGTRISVAKHRGDVAALSGLRPWVQELSAEVGRNAELARSAKQMLASISRAMAFISGDYAAARTHNETIAQLSTTPQAAVGSEYGMAEIEDALGDTAAAWPHYSFVDEYGGTIAARATAKAWLAAHSLKA